MKKIIKSFLMMLLAIILCMTSLPIYATDTCSTITPRLSHMNKATFDFLADSSGGHVEVYYYGNSSSFVQAKISVKVQKQFLWVFWSDVDEWSSTSTELYGNFYHIFTLNGSGTYRAQFTLEVTGADGTIDVVTDTIENSY